MDILPIVDRLGESPAAALFGLITGVIFGVSAQRSTFCLRAATVEFAHGSGVKGKLGPKVAVWLLTLSTAIVWVQGAQLLGLFRAADARIMAVPGSWSGAMIGGLMFGAGMVLSRGLFGSAFGSCLHRKSALCCLRPDFCRYRTNEPSRHPRSLS